MSDSNPPPFKPFLTQFPEYPSAAMLSYDMEYHCEVYVFQDELSTGEVVEKDVCMPSTPRLQNEERTYDSTPISPEHKLRQHFQQNLATLKPLQVDQLTLGPVESIHTWQLAPRIAPTPEDADIGTYFRLPIFLHPRHVQLVASGSIVEHTIRTFHLLNRPLANGFYYRYATPIIFFGEDLCDPIQYRIERCIFHGQGLAMLTAIAYHLGTRTFLPWNDHEFGRILLLIPSKYNAVQLTTAAYCWRQGRRQISLNIQHALVAECLMCPLPDGLDNPCGPYQSTGIASNYPQYDAGRVDSKAGNGSSST